jgi:tetratricopeptide (TPR) repeat protein
MVAVILRKLLLPVVVLLSVGSQAQFKTSGVGNLRVLVVYTDDRAVTEHARVQLMNSAMNNSVNEQYTNDLGEVEFYSIDVGDYHIVVTGEGIQDTDSGIFEVDDRKGSQSITIAVKKTGEGGRTGKAGGPSVSVKQLKIPSDARSKYDEATQLMAKSDWAGAIGRLNQAVALYPAYAEAYNNLAAAHARLGEWKQAREALENATRVDDHFAAAFVNLAHLDEKEKDYQAAEAQLEKAVALDPANADTLTQLCRDQLLDKHYEASIRTAQRVHAMPHKAYAVVHYIAARAFQRENRPADAIVEFKVLLQEEPAGGRADAVRKELAEMESREH